MRCDMIRKIIISLVILTVFQRVFAQDMQLAFVYNDYADRCVDQGLYIEAKDAYMKSLEQVPLDADPVCRPILCQKLSAVSRALADYSEAVSYIDMADSLIVMSGVDDPSLRLDILITRAQLNHDMGGAYEALGLVTKAMELALPGTERYSATAQLAADLHIDCEQYGEALSILQMEVLPSASSAADSLYAYQSIAKAYSQAGKQSYARTVLDQAEKLLDERMAGDVMLKAGFYDTKAYAEEKCGNYSSAYDCYSKEYEIISSLWGEEHPQVISSLYGMAKSSMMSGSYDEAWRLYCDYLQRKKRYLSSEFFRMNSNDVASYWNSSNEGVLDAPLFCHVSGLVSGKETGEVLNAVMFAKSATLDLSMSFADVVEKSRDSVAVNSYRQLRDCRAQGRHLLARTDNESRSLLENLRREADALEKDIRVRLYALGHLRDTLDFADWRQTASGFPENMVAIEFASFSDKNTLRYCAFAYSKNSSYPEYIPLCSHDDLVSICGDGVSYTSADVKSRFSQSNMERLYVMLWKPLERYLHPETDVCFAPCGLLNDIPMEYLISDGVLAVEKCRTMHRTNVTKEISSVHSTDSFDRLYVYGGIHYGEADNTRAAASRFPFLKDSRLEVEAIRRSMGRKIPVRERTFRRATEEDFKNLAFNPSEKAILHFSTHGFYLPASEASAYYYYSKFTSEDLVRYPLLRCGLAMAGADLAWTGTAPFSNTAEDGILTAQEISDMDLGGVALVVLAACQTGLGDLGSEGVMGMQRAFRMAGAESMLVSLWLTDDEATIRLMTEFYQALSEGIGVHAALKRSVLKLRSMPGKQNPYYWAPFVIVD